MRLHAAALACALLSAHAAEARIVSVRIDKVEPFADGMAFGATGPYERAIGVAKGELDPNDKRNALIAGIDQAPRNARGMVEYSATFTILRPADMSKASGVLLYLVPNRGNINMTNGGFFVDARKRGHVIVASGWQGDLDPAPNKETMTVPVAKNPDGSSITGPALARFTDMKEGASTVTIMRGGVAGTADPASLDTSKATFTRRASETGMVIPINNADWAFADCNITPFPGKPDPRKVCLKGGFNPTYLYELVYTAKDPKVYGIGFAATRDLNSYLRYGAQDDAGTANPVAGKITATVSQGNSQSGNYLRSFIHLGFNQDETGRIVFDGANPERAVRLLGMNIRFAAPSGAAELYGPGSDGVLWWEHVPDPGRGRPAAGMLDRCRATETCPKIIETFGSAEFYNLRASPDLVGTRADRDIPLPSNVRRYYSPGVRHGGGPGGFDPDAKLQGCCGLTPNPNPSIDTLRSLQTALIDWVVKGTLPPPSQYPRLDRGDLVAPTAAAMGFPAIPGVPLPDGILTPLYQYEFGPKIGRAHV